MVRGDQMPRQPKKSLSLDTVVKRPEPQRGIQASDSADESLFGKFVKARHLDLVDEDEVPSRPRQEFHRSASASKLSLGKSKPSKQRSSPAADTAHTRPSSMRSMTLRSESPGPPPSPDPPRPQSLRSIKSRSRSPSVKKKDLATILSVPPSPRVSTPKLPKSPKAVHPRGQSKGRSPKSPTKASKGDLLKQGISPLLPLDDLLATPPPSPPSTDDIITTTATTNILNKSNHEDLPALVDDSLVREKLEGQRGSTQWNIMEDTPAGHAEEKLTIISAVENDDQSSDWRTDPSEGTEEDDDIIDDADEHSLVVARFRRRNSLPTDPSSVYTSTQSQGETAAKNDRFAPGFNNHEMWSGGAKLDTQLPPVKRSISADASLLSDDWMSLGEMGDSIALDISEQPNPGELRGRKSDVCTTTGFSIYNNETPSTIKQTGRSPLEKIEHIPSLDTDSSSKEPSSSASSRFPIAHKNTAGKNFVRKSSEQPRKDTVQPESKQEPKGSTSTGRSSERRTTQKPRKERDALRGRKPPKIPEVIPAGQEVDMRSPSTLTSTQISVLSSSRSRQQGQGLQALRQRHTKQSPKPQKSRPLHLHVESGNGHASSHDDDYTIGASTITTNFSITQRTMSDNTVSIRSLFQPNSTSSSQVPRLPQRCDEEGDFDDNAVDAKNPPPQQPKRSEDDEITNSMHIPDTEMSIEDLFNGKVSSRKPLGSSDGYPSVLRRPSGDADDVLEMIESSHSRDGSDHAEDISLQDSGAFNSPSRPGARSLNKIPLSPRSPSQKSSSKPSSQASLHRHSGTSIEPPDRPNLPKPTRQSSSSNNKNNTNPLQVQQPKDSTTGDAIPTISERIYDGIGRSPGSPSESSKKNKRRSKLGLFKRVASWKGAVPLEDDDA